MRYGALWLMFHLLAVKGFTKLHQKVAFNLFHSSVTVRLATSSEINPILQFNAIDDALEAYIPPFKPFRIEFQASRLRASTTERVVKAASSCDLVFDLTAGLGRDAVVLAAAGRRVVMVERNELLYQLLHDGIRRLHLEAPRIAQQVCLIHADSTLISSSELMQKAVSHFNLTNSKSLAINVYLDPMYPTPPGDRKAKSRKGTQILQALTESVSHDSSDNNDGRRLKREEGLLFTAACGLANGRIVVKRGLNDPPLRVPDPRPQDCCLNSDKKSVEDRFLKPHSAVEGSTQRFDLYFVDRLLPPQQTSSTATIVRYCKWH